MILQKDAENTERCTNSQEGKFKEIGKNRSFSATNLMYENISRHLTLSGPTIGEDFGQHFSLFQFGFRLS